MFNEPAFNTFDKALASERDELRNYEIEKIINIEVTTIEKILKKVNSTSRIDVLFIILKV